MIQAELRQDLYEKFGMSMNRTDIARYFRCRRAAIPVEKLTQFQVGGKGKRYDIDSVANWVFRTRAIGTYK
jgi:hypothetical protein